MNTHTPHQIFVRAATSEHGVVLHVSGEADVSTAPVLLGRLLEAVAQRPVSLRVELQEVTFCGLAGCDALHAAVAAAGAAGVPLKLCYLTPVARWIYDTFPPPVNVPGPRGPGPGAVAHAGVAADSATRS